jgi:hypothetical protein
MRKYAGLFLRLTLVFVPAVVLLVAQTDRTNAFTGTWKLNVAKSHFDPGPPPHSEAVTMAPDGTFTVEAVSAEGKAIKWSHPWSGGKEVPVSGIEKATVITKVQGRTIDDTMKISGKIMQTAHVVLSPDGKTCTTTGTGTNAQGHPVHNVEIFDKQ